MWASARMFSPELRVRELPSFPAPTSSDYLDAGIETREYLGGSATSTESKN